MVLDKIVKQEFLIYVEKKKETNLKNFCSLLINNYNCGRIYDIQKIEEYNKKITDKTKEIICNPSGEKDICGLANKKTGKLKFIVTQYHPNIYTIKDIKQFSNYDKYGEFTEDMEKMYKILKEREN